MGSFLGQHKHTPATKLGAAAIAGAIQSSGLSVASAAEAGLSEVYLGNVLSANLGQNPAKQAATLAGLPSSTSCTLVNKVCASGMKAVMLAASSVLCGLSDFAVGGGMESMSNSPYYDTTRRGGTKMGDQLLLDSILRDGLLCASRTHSGKHMGDLGELCAAELRISRQAQDDYAIESFHRVRIAQERDLLAKEIVPSTEGAPLDDEPPKRFDASRMRTLKPYFQSPLPGSSGSITAANASPLTDGAAALLLGREHSVRRLGLPVRARIIGMADAGQGAEWYSTTPVAAVNKLLASTGKSEEDIDAWEINEAFSMVALANISILDLDHAKVNMHGGAVALGHPIGASGARILLSLVSVLEAINGRIGVATVCNGGGGASAMMIERI